MDILMCCGQGGGDNSKFHISLIHKHSDSYGYIDVLCEQGGYNSKFHISLIHKHSDSNGYIDVLCEQGGDNSKFHISLIQNIQTVMDILMCCVNKGGQL